MHFNQNQVAHVTTRGFELKIVVLKTKGHAQSATQFQVERDRKESWHDVVVINDTQRQCYTESKDRVCDMHTRTEADPSA